MCEDSLQVVLKYCIKSQRIKVEDYRRLTYCDIGITEVLSSNSNLNFLRLFFHFCLSNAHLGNDLQGMLLFISLCGTL